MSMLFAGKIETIKTNVATLLTRLTSGRATLLDNLSDLDAPISTVDTNVDTLLARLTSTRAGYLDQAISEAGAKAPTAFPTWTPGTHNQDNMDDALDSGITDIQRRLPRFEWASASVSTLNTWEDIINITGPGVMQFLAVWQTANASSRDTDLRIVIDGTTVLTVTTMWATSSVQNQGTGGGGIFVGFMEWDDTNGGLLQGSMQLEDIQFKTSFVVQHRITESGGGTQTVDCLYRKYLT